MTWSAPPSRAPSTMSNRPRFPFPDSVFAHHLHQHAFPQPPVGDPQALAGECRPDCIENGAAGENEIGALGSDAGIGDPILVAHGQQPLDNARRLLVAHPASVDATPLIPLEL